jgi:rare lipoprotein A
VADSAPSSIDAPVWQDAVPRPDPLLSNGNTSPYEVNGQTYTVLATHRGYREQGTASWYGMKFQGRPTANGEIFDVFAATAAHRSLPIPSYVRVTHLLNHPDRLIDLSYGAAKQLGFAEQGTALVRVESIDLAGVDDRRASAALTYRYLQLGAYESPDTADQVVREVTDRWGYPATTSLVDAGGKRLHRVRVGPFADPQALERARAALMESGHQSPQRLP